MFVSRLLCKVEPWTSSGSQQQQQQQEKKIPTTIKIVLEWSVYETKIYSALSALPVVKGVSTSTTALLKRQQREGIIISCSVFVHTQVWYIWINNRQVILLHN